MAKQTPMPDDERPVVEIDPVPPGHELVPDDELDRCAAFYSARLGELRTFTPDELRAPADLRLYRARATSHWVLIRGRDPEYGTGIDSRRPVWA